MMLTTILTLFLLAGISFVPLPSEGHRLAEEDYFVWGASMVQADDGVYHVFYSRWKKELGFQAWVSHSEIAHATSKSPFGPFELKGVALPARGSQFWDGMCMHNPTVHKFGDKYYLYYMGNSGDGKVVPAGELNFSHRNRQRIGVAMADSPDGPWTRKDEPLIDVSSEDDAPDALMTSNPSVTQCPDGSFLMVYKGVGKHRPLPFGGPVVHLTAKSTAPDGPFVKQLKPIFTAEGSNFPAEDPFVWYQDGYWAIVKDMHGSFTGAGKSLALFHSDNGFDWAPYNDGNGCLVLGLSLKKADGGEEEFSNLERPQLLFDEKGRPSVLLLAAAKKKDGVVTETFNVQLEINYAPTSSLR